MNEEAADAWGRALQALKTAARLVDDDPDAAASRAYYAAFHAVSAFFALEGRSFGKHTAVQAAVHRDLVKAGRLSLEGGAAYASLVDLRNTGDYGGPTHIDAPQAREAVRKAELVVEGIRRLAPGEWPES